MRRAAIVFGLFFLGCGDGETSEDSPAPGRAGECPTASRFASGVVDHSFGSGQDFGQDEFPEAVLGPPSGGGCCKGSLEVTSLGEGGFVTLAFDSVIVDGPGPDFIVFENAFLVDKDDPESAYAELGVVSVSEDGEHFVAFECDGSEFPFAGCAGARPVIAYPGKNDVDPFDPQAAGGDAFDLADVGLNEVRYVRVEDLPEEQVGEGTFDLDAVAIVNAACD